MASGKKRTSKKNKFNVSLQEFSRYTSIPWLKFFFDTRLSNIERTLIAAVLTVASVYMFSMVYAVCRNVFSYPLITNIESLQFPAWYQPFPSILICPRNRFSKDGIVKQVDKWILPKNISKKEMLDKLRSLPSAAYKLKLIDDHEIIEEVMTINKVSMNHLLEQITLPCDKIIGLCKWNSVETDCGEIFEKVITPEGHCCTFNYHIHTKQELEKSDMRTISGSGITTGLKLTLFSNFSDAFNSISSSQGYAIYAGPSGSYLDRSASGSGILRRKSANFLSFTSTRIEHTEAVKQLPVHDRPCSGPEHKLSAFKFYSIDNCKIECIMSMCLKYCGCIPIIYPKYSDNQRFCEFSDLKCLNTIRDTLKRINSGSDLTEYMDNELEMKRTPSCGCLPSCDTHYIYEVAASSTHINDDFIQQSLPSTIPPNLPYENMNFFCDVYVYSQGNLLTKIITDIKYDFTNLLGSIGTIASFIMGWSIISVIEILHFLIQEGLKYSINTIKYARGVIQNKLQGT
ncbi:sodium channel protein Nach-like [Nilaparvata lugens]|uniref:sodium channel protein Nach-like n=1 Tax=Nilaparvata lugens TaxID=108931 RepID=UPI00193CFCC1|nr:sodium channel protein Nach-like [Nilaparvata lugens]